MKRRTLLGSALALAGLPGAAEAAERGEVSVGECGTSKASLPSHGGLWSNVEMRVGGVDEETEVSVNGYHFDDDEDPGVDIFVTTSQVRLNLGLSPEEARELATDLVVAADHAKGDNP